MKWAALAKEILESTKARTDITDISPTCAVKILEKPESTNRHNRHKYQNDPSVGSVGSHYSAFVENLTAFRAIPEHVQQFLIDAQYGDDLPGWEPESCQRFLKQLEEEFTEFEVHGWHGCRMPEKWPEGMKLAVQSIYIRSLQPPDDWTCPAGCKSHKTYWTSPSGVKVCSTCHPRPEALR